MVDLSKAKAGDIVKFRCGGECKVPLFVDNGNWTTLMFRGQSHNGQAAWRNDGRWDSDSDHPLDIIAIEPAPFNWADVRPGMAFKRAEYICFYIGPMALKGCDVVVQFEDGSCAAYLPIALKRAPEHDIEVPS